MVITTTAIFITILAIFIWSVYKEQETISWISGLLFFFGGLIIYGVIFSTSTETTRMIAVHVSEIVKGKHVTVVATDNNYTNVYSGYESDKITDTTKFYWIEKYNYYNIKLNDSEFVHK